MKFVAIIPARSGSKGVPGKNIKEVFGKPLIVWSIEQALESKHISSVIVSTDSQAIADIALNAGALVPELRPSHLAEDETPTEPVLIYALQNWFGNQKPDAVVLLQPTSPIRLPGTIDSAINQFIQEKSDSLFSTNESHGFFWRSRHNPTPLYNYNDRPRRQDILQEDRWYQENGSIYITKVDLLLNEGNRLGGNMSMYVMDEIESHDIDTEIDFIIVSQLLKIAIEKIDYGIL